MLEPEDQIQYGVLLYYKYAQIPDLNELVSFYQSNCSSLGLLGRVRLAPDGVNVTVGGKLSSLEKHIASVKSNSLFLGTDFKLATCHYPFSNKVAKECGFTSLSVRLVKELVTFSSHPSLKSPEISNAGRHLSAAEFHTVLQSAGKVSGKVEDAVLLDARNLYETRIGKFHTEGVETLVPGIRQYSDLPSWIDNNSNQFHGKRVLMYCTGGIRCEMASAYIRSKGAGFENVLQLFGGIQRYLEQFPDGGFFKGKNFVFDHRIAVGSSDANIMGTCLTCDSSFDDYSSRCRCTYCRMLVLVCDSCRMEDAIYICELCQKHGKGYSSAPSIENGISEVSPRSELKFVASDTTLSPVLPRRHGKVCYLYHFKRIDLKFAVPLSPFNIVIKTGTGTMPPRKLRILCLHGFRQNASSFKGRTGSLAKKLKNIAEFVFVDAPHELPFIYQPHPTEAHHNCPSSELQLSPFLPSENCKRKFAWLVAPDFSASNKTNWKMANCPFDPLQYQQQTEGFDVSLAYLKIVFCKEGPFDGILGFSQGAAMAALLSAHQVRLKDEIDFRFVILCSGFPLLNLAENVRGPINCPSLHVFGSDTGKDRQIANQASKDLASYFEDGSSVIIEHDSGHIIPTRSPFIDEIKDFLGRFA